MIAKLTVYGKDRTEAIERMIRAIDECQITGITTTLGFGRFVMQHEAFTSGNFDTHFVKKYFTPEVLNTYNEAEAGVAAMIMSQLFSQKKTVAAAAETAEISDWVKNRSRLQ